MRYFLFYFLINFQQKNSNSLNKSPNFCNLKNNNDLKGSNNSSNSCVTNNIHENKNNYKEKEIPQQIYKNSQAIPSNTTNKGIIKTTSDKISNYNSPTLNYSNINPNQVDNYNNIIYLNKNRNNTKSSDLDNEEFTFTSEIPLYANEFTDNNKKQEFNNNLSDNINKKNKINSSNSSNNLNSNSGIFSKINPKKNSNFNTSNNSNNNYNNYKKNSNSHNSFEKNRSASPTMINNKNNSITENLTTNKINKNNN